MQPERQFDFWLGEWDAVWEGGSGTNRVAMGFDGKVVQENFNAPDLIGMSVSVYDLDGRYGAKPGWITPARISTLPAASKMEK